jgi:hypothetical protein
MQLVGYLSSLDRDVATDIAKVAPEILAQSGSDITIVKATNPTGYALQSGAIRYFDFTYVAETTEYHRNIRMVPPAQFDQAPGHPSATIVGETFLPCDPLNRRWNSQDDRTFFNGNGEVVRYRYVATPAALTGPTSSLTSPDFARPYFETALATMILMLNSAPAPMITGFMERELRMRRQLGLAIYTMAQKSTSWGQVGQMDYWRYY